MDQRPSVSVNMTGELRLYRAESRMIAADVSLFQDSIKEPRSLERS